MVRSDTMDKQWQSCIQINPKYDGEKVVSEVQNDGYKKNCFGSINNN